MVSSQFGDWFKLLWDEINSAQLEEETKGFQKIVKGMDKEVRKWDVYLGIDGEIKNFLASVALSSALPASLSTTRFAVANASATGFPCRRSR